MADAFSSKRAASFRLLLLPSFLAGAIVCRGCARNEAGRDRSALKGADRRVLGFPHPVRKRHGFCSYCEERIEDLILTVRINLRRP